MELSIIQEREPSSQAINNIEQTPQSLRKLRFQQSHLIDFIPLFSFHSVTENQVQNTLPLKISQHNQGQQHSLN